MKKFYLCLLALASLGAAGGVAFAADQVASCAAPAVGCTVIYVPATPDTQSFNSATGAECWVTQASCVFRKLSAMKATDKVFARTGTTGAVSWQSVSAVTFGTVTPPPPPPPPATGTGTATLTWTAPTQNTDGTAITGALSFNVYKGASAAALTLLKAVSGGPTTDTGLAAGTYYYAVSAVNNSGVESARSAAASLTIAPPVTTPKTPSAPGLLTISATISTP
jgi:hypothetical protein